jgi:hypothetical protein
MVERLFAINPRISLKGLSTPKRCNPSVRAIRIPRRMVNLFRMHQGEALSCSQRHELIGTDVAAKSGSIFVSRQRLS